MSRIGNMHLSYRTERLGWRQYGDEIFVVSLLVFWGLVVHQYRSALPAARIDRPIGR